SAPPDPSQRLKGALSRRKSREERQQRQGRAAPCRRWGGGAAPGVSGRGRRRAADAEVGPALEAGAAARLAGGGAVRRCRVPVVVADVARGAAGARATGRALDRKSVV